MALKNAFWYGSEENLSTESVEGTSLTFQGVDDVHGGDGLSLGVLSVGDCITDHVLQENLEDTSGLFVDESRDTFDTTSTSQSSDGWLGDTLDVVSQNLAMTLGASLSESLASFASSRHFVELISIGREESFLIRVRSVAE